MKFLCILILSCLAFSSVHAESKNKAKTNFETLGEMFSQGTLPKKEDTFGWWSGRCYSTERPNKPLPRLLVSRIVIKNDGPAFPEKDLHQMRVLEARIGSPANYFDTNDLLDFEDSVRELLRGSEEPIAHGTFIATEKNDSLYASFNRNFKLVYELRKYNDFFIMTRYQKDSDVHSNCYFFKKVYPKHSFSL